MRKNVYFSLLLLLAIVIVLSACGSGSGNMHGQKNDPNQTKSHQSKNTISKKNKKNGNMTKNNDAKSSDDKKNGHILNVTAHDFAFNKKVYYAKNGKITIHFKSRQGHHGFALYKNESSSDKIVNIIGKGTKTVKLTRGKYYIHCSVVCGAGHGQMDAHLIVK